MQQSDSEDVSSNLSPRSDPGGAAGRFQPSAKSMEKMERLAKWRIDPSLIEFPKDAEELHGGHATVSRAILSLSPNSCDNEGGSDAQSHSEQKASDAALDVAVKKLKISANKDLDRLLGLTLREAGFLVEFSHPNIVSLEGFLEDVSEGIIWLVFPWEANGNLRDFVASRDWEIPERIWLIDDVARGVEYLHSQNPPICHGDLKSVNVLVNSECSALITDFGSARRIAERDLDTETEQVGNERQFATRLEATFCASTNTITLTGNEYTLRWAAPELLKDEPPTVKIDIWALGWIAYEVMTNAIPFEDVVKESIVIKRVTQGHLPSITGDARMSLMLRLCWLMSQCWSADPGQRPTATDCRRSLSWMPMIAPNPNPDTSAMVPDIRSPRLLLQLAKMHRQQSDYANASKFYMEALDIFTDTNDRRGRAETLEGLAQTRQLQGEAEEAIALYCEALEISTSIDDMKKKADVLWGLGRTYTIQRNHSQAVAFCSDALEIYTELGNINGKADALYGLAEVHRLQDEYSQATTHYSDALRLFADLGDQQGRASAMWGLAEVYRLQNDYNQAITFFSSALQIYTDIGDTHGRGVALAGVADVKRDQGYHNDAIGHYEQAAKVLEQIGDTHMIASLSEDAAEARRLAGLEEASAL